MSQRNKIPTRSLPSRWMVGAVAQAVTGVPLVGAKGQVINYGEGKGGGLQNGKIAGPKLFAPPP